MRMAQGIGAERVDFRSARINASECFEIVGREIEARLDGLTEVERVIADLHIVEHPRPHESVLILIAEAHEQGFQRLRPDAIGAIEGLAYVDRAARLNL